MYWYGMALCSKDIQTRWTKGLVIISMRVVELAKCKCYIPEATSIQLEVFFFGVVLDSCQSIACGLLVVGLLGRVSALVCVGHCGSIVR